MRLPRTCGARSATGITSVRDAGGADLGIQQALKDGLIAGPRIQLSLSMLSQTGGHAMTGCRPVRSSSYFQPHPGRPSGIVDGPDEMRRKVRELVRAGADVIKVATSGGVLSTRDDPRHAHFRPAELEVLVEEATAAGIFVMAHAQGADGIKNAVRAGIRSIEHGIFLDDEGIELMLQRGTWLVPTLVAPQGVIAAVEAGAQLPPAVVEKAFAVVEIHKTAFARAVRGRRARGHGHRLGRRRRTGENLRELELMAAGGMSPAAVLEATTRSAAELMGLEHDLGTIEPGKLADLVVVAGDAYALADLAERVEGVWQAGRQVAGEPFAAA